MDFEVSRHAALTFCMLLAITVTGSPTAFSANFITERRAGRDVRRVTQALLPTPRQKQLLLNNCCWMLVQSVLINVYKGDGNKLPSQPMPAVFLVVIK